MGAGELVSELSAAGVSLTVVEIDPRVEEMARRFFGLALAHERIHIADGRALLERDRALYDYLCMDAFLGEDVPGHLYTREAFAAMRRRLAPGGLLALNYTSLPEGQDARSVALTLRAAFPHVKVFTDGSAATDLGSTVLLASASPITLAGPEAADESVQLFLANEAPVPASGGTILTDDYNPINVYRLGATRLWRSQMIRYVGEDWAYWADF
jgi:spermidine synthase